MNSESGMSLVAVMIAFGLVGVIALALTSLTGQMNQVKTQANAAATAAQLRQNAAMLLNNAAAWENTVTRVDNDTFECVRVYRKCEPAVNDSGFKLTNPAGKTYFDATMPTAGFTRGGAPCTGFPSESCPFRIRLKWDPQCLGEEPCHPSLIHVSGHVEYDAGPNPRQHVNINPANYSFEVYRTVEGGNVGTRVRRAARDDDGPDSNPNSGSRERIDEQTRRLVCGTLGPHLGNPTAMQRARESMARMGYSDEQLDAAIDQARRICR